MPEGASVPALGLSNKAVFQGESTPSSDGPLQPQANEQYPEVYFSPLHMDSECASPSSGLWISNCS